MKLDRGFCYALIVIFVILTTGDFGLTACGCCSL